MEFTPDREITILESIDEYLVEKSEGGILSEASVGNRLIELNRFASFCESIKIKTPNRIHINHLKAYFKSLNISNGTKKTLINVYRGYFDYMEDQRLILDNIATRIERLKSHKAMPDFLTMKELERVYKLEAKKASEKVKDRNLLMLSLMVETGLRASELTGVQLEDVRLESRQIWITQKGGDKSFVPFPKSIAEQFKTWYSVRPSFKGSEELEDVFLATSGRPMNRKQIYEIVSNAISRAGLAKRKNGPHILRHTGATLRALRGDDIEKIRVWLRHRTYTMAQIYIHAAEVIRQQSVDNEVLKDKWKYRN